MAGHSRSKNGVASLAYDPAIHDDVRRIPTVRFPALRLIMDARVKPAHDAEGVARALAVIFRTALRARSLERLWKTPAFFPCNALTQKVFTTRRRLRSQAAGARARGGRGK
jgi:hypothetical protein